VSDWRRTVVCGTGPSFSADQAASISAVQRGGLCKVIVVNDAWERVPTADTLYAADAAWWKARRTAQGPRNFDRVRMAGFRGELLTQARRTADELSLAYIRGYDDPGLTKRPDCINNGKNGSYQAINIAYLRGAKHIILVGVDMQRTGGAQHFFGDHPPGLVNSIPFAECLPRFALLAAECEAAGVCVVNGSAETALRCFRRARLTDALIEWEDSRP
jgi:hypothetical protein